MSDLSSSPAALTEEAGARMAPERAAVVFHNARRDADWQWGEDTPIGNARRSALTRAEQDYASADAEIVRLSVALSTAQAEVERLTRESADARVDAQLYRQQRNAARADVARLEAERAATDGVALIAAERRRQVEAEGWTPDHDDQHQHDELAIAASCYALPSERREISPFSFLETPKRWPWSPEWWRPSIDRVRELAKAGALIAAEIDRLQRAAATPSTETAT